MLDIFTKSKIRQRLILLFLYNRGRQFYLSEIARAAGTSPGTAQRELNKLLKSDLIKFEKKMGLNLYVINKNYSLLDEVESIVRKTIGIEVELGKKLDKIKGIAFAFLFGSYVKGGFKSDSDIDLFVIGKVDEDRIFKIVQEVEEIVGREINYHIADEKDFSKKLREGGFYKDIVKNYTLLTGDKDGFRELIKRAG